MLLRLAAACVLGLPVGWERESRDRTPGLRTFPLVALGACAFLLIGEHVFAGEADARARVLQALLTGVGFLGGGAILKEKGEVHGVATATGVWSTAGIGAATAHGEFLLALVLSLLTTLTLHVHLPRSCDPR
ncbi:MgtC/SapB family protein [Aggregicoccus sp. 17bor-14]|nr:MgtC/SapB family protein [Simulacricoccus sp. 17bor-14]MRI88651.1 MgtC/SapB family protein [Aggregicoccus sp. 17bor-14]